MTSHDISSFMSWWVNQVVSIIGYCWNTLDSIQFAGTSMLRVLIMIVVFSALLKVTLTIPQGIANGISERTPKEDYIKYKQNMEKNAKKALRGGK